MAKSKTQAVDQEATTSGGNGPAEGQAISKVDAMRDAVEQLGQDAKNKDLGDYIRSKYGEQAVPANFSVTKSAVMKKLRQGNGRRKGRRGGARQTAAQPAPPPSPSTGGGISLEDLRQIKELAGRYGKDQIKGFLDLLA